MVAAAEGVRFSNALILYVPGATFRNTARPPESLIACLPASLVSRFCINNCTLAAGLPAASFTVTSREFFSVSAAWPNGRRRAKRRTAKRGIFILSTLGLIASRCQRGDPHPADKKQTFSALLRHESRMTARCRVGAMFVTAEPRARWYCWAEHRENSCTGKQCSRGPGPSQG